MAHVGERSKAIRKLRKSLRLRPLRFVHIFFCVILTLYGVGIFLLTLYVRSHLSGYLEFLEYYLNKPVLVLIVGSIALIGLGCLGTISSAQNIYQGIVTFGVLLFGLFMFKLTMGAVVLATLNSADSSVTQALELYVNNHTENSDAMDYIQSNLDCCGINDFTDWNSTLGYIPGSCCDSDSACRFDDVTNLNETGCYEALKTLVNYLMVYLALILGVLAILQITAMVITFFLARGIADIRKRISEYSSGIDSDTTTSVPEVPELVHNPLAMRNSLPPKVNHERNSPVPCPVKIFGSDSLPGPKFAPIRNESFVRHPVYSDVTFGYGQNPPHGMVTPTAPPMPLANRRFPIGF